MAVNYVSRRSWLKTEPHVRVLDLPDGRRLADVSTREAVRIIRGLGVDVDPRAGADRVFEAYHDWLEKEGGRFSSAWENAKSKNRQ